MWFQGDHWSESFPGSGARTVPCARLPTTRPATPVVRATPSTDLQLTHKPGLFSGQIDSWPHTCSTSLLNSSFNMTDVGLCSSYSSRNLVDVSARLRSKMWKKHKLPSLWKSSDLFCLSRAIGFFIFNDKTFNFTV